MCYAASEGTDDLRRVAGSNWDAKEQGVMMELRGDLYPAVDCNSALIDVFTPLLLCVSEISHYSKWS